MGCCFGRSEKLQSLDNDRAYIHDDIADAVNFFAKHGFVVLSPSMASLPQRQLEAVDNWAVAQKCTSEGNLRDNEKLRFSMNNDTREKPQSVFVGGALGF